MSVENSTQALKTAELVTLMFFVYGKSTKTFGREHWTFSDNVVAVMVKQYSILVS